MQRFRAPIQRALALVPFAFCLTNAHAVSFTGTGLGPIPDGSLISCVLPTGATPLVVSFAVSGLTAPISTVGVRIAFSPMHTFVGDLHVQLAAPGGSPNMTLFGNTGAVLGVPSGSGANAKGPYTFSDTQAGDWWATVIATDPFATIPAGGYRTSGENSATPTSLNFIFAGITAAQANGTWTLSFTDDCTGDTGSVSEATLFIDDVAMPVRLETYSID